MVTEEERIQQLEKELEETIMAGEDSDRRFEEVSKIKYLILNITWLNKVKMCDDMNVGRKIFINIKAIFGL